MFSRDERAASGRRFISIVPRLATFIGLCGLALSQVDKLPRVSSTAEVTKRLQIANRIVVPDLSEKNLADAAALLMALNLKLGTVNSLIADNSRVDHVLKQSVQPQT